MSLFLLRPWTRSSSVSILDMPSPRNAQASCSRLQNFLVGSLRQSTSFEAQSGTGRFGRRRKRIAASLHVSDVVRVAQPAVGAVLLGWVRASWLDGLSLAPPVRRGHAHRADTPRLRATRARMCCASRSQRACSDCEHGSCLRLQQTGTRPPLLAHLQCSCEKQPMYDRLRRGFGRCTKRARDVQPTLDSSLCHGLFACQFAGTAIPSDQA